MKRSLLTLTFAVMVIFALSMGSAYAADDVMKATQGYGAGAWYTSIYGEVRDNAGNTVSARSDLGHDNALGFNGDLDFELSDKWGLGLNFFYVKSTSTGYRVNRTINYAGTVVPVNDTVTSTIKTTTTTLAIKYNLARNEDGQLDIQLSPKMITFEANARAATAGNLFTPVDETVFIPTIGLSGKQRLSERLYLYGNVEGMGYKSNSLIDARADLRWNFQHPGWFATLGYRYYQVRLNDINNTINRASLHWNGPVATLRYEF